MQLNYYRRGQGEPLVLIHGIGSRWQMWEPVIDSLAAHRDVIAIDLPGFGASPMPPAGTPAGVDSLTSLVAEFLDELGVERPHFAGNSLGGLIVLELAKRGVVRSANGVSPAGFANRPERLLAEVELRLAVSSARRLVDHVKPLAARPRGRKLLLEHLRGPSRAGDPPGRSGERARSRPRARGSTTPWPPSTRPASAAASRSRRP